MLFRQLWLIFNLVFLLIISIYNTNTVLLAYYTDISITTNIYKKN